MFILIEEFEHSTNWLVETICCCCPIVWGAKAKLLHVPIPKELCVVGVPPGNNCFKCSTRASNSAATVSALTESRSQNA